MSVVLKRVAQLALVLCALMPLIAAAHGNHAKPNANAGAAPAWQHEANIAPAVAAAPSQCPTEGGRMCGCHGPSCMRVGEPDMIAPAPTACVLQPPSVPSLLLLNAAVPPPSTPLTRFPPRAPPFPS